MFQSQVRSEPTLGIYPKSTELKCENIKQQAKYGGKLMNRDFAWFCKMNSDAGITEKRHQIYKYTVFSDHQV